MINQFKKQKKLPEWYSSNSNKFKKSFLFIKELMNKNIQIFYYTNKQHNKNYCSCSGSINNNPQISIGYYENNELLFISILHQLIHLIDKQKHKNIYQMQKYTWSKTLLYFNRYYKKNKKIIEFVNKCIQQYNIQQYNSYDASVV